MATKMADTSSSSISAQHDAMGIASLLGEPEVPTNALKFASRQQEYLVPSSSSYLQSVNFDMKGITDRWVTFDEAELYLPLTITTQNAMANAFPTIGFKSSALSCIKRIVVKSANGAPIIDDDQSELFASHLRLAFEKDQSWVKLVAPQIHYARDRPHDGIVGMYKNALIQPPGTAKYAAVPAIGLATNDGNGLSAGYNAGFHERQGMMMKAYASSVGADPVSLDTKQTFDIVLSIPLRVLHSFFRELDFPMIGNRLQMEFWLANVSAGPFRPVVLGTAVEAARTQAAGGVTDIAVTAGAEPRLYYHAVQWQPSQLAIVSQKFAAGGLRKLLHHRKYEIYKDAQAQTNVANGSTFNYTVSTSAVAARRLWILCYPTGTFNGTTHPSALVTGANGFSSLQVSLNGKTMFNNPLTTLREQYAELKQAMHLGGDGDPESLIPFFDFKLFSRIHCIDLSRSTSLMVDPSQPVTISVQSTVASAGAVDVVFLLETEQRVALNMSGQSATVVTGPAV